jgi:hypothetical protein
LEAGEKQRAKVRYMGHLEQPEDAEDDLVSCAYLYEFLSPTPRFKDFCRQNLGPKFEITLVAQ